MIETVLRIFLSLDFWTITFPTFTAILAGGLNERSKRKWEKWSIKKDACLKALNLANAVLSNYEYQNVKIDEIEPQYTTIEDTRSCFNELACTCDSPCVIEELKKIMFGTVSLDAIVDLRNAVRKKLEFGHEQIDVDRKRSFIGKLNCLKDESQQTANTVDV